MVKKLLLSVAAVALAASVNAQIVKNADGTYERRFVLEEYTGAGCQWCTRGYAGMERLNEVYGDKFVGLALHQYGSDAMSLKASNWAKISWPGAPSAMLDRNGVFIDPLYGTIQGNNALDDMDELVAAELAVGSVVGVSITGEWNEEQTEVTATATVETSVEGTYEVAFALVADSLTGTGSGWNQANAYATYQPSGEYPGLDRFCKGGEYGQSSVKGLYFNDVVIGSSYVSRKNTVEKIESLAVGEQTTRTFTLPLPTTGKLVDAIRKQDISVVALVFGEGSTIINAAKYYLTPRENGGETSITNVAEQQAAEVARYTIDGRQISAPQKGINIVRLSNGKTVKVVVK